jgi:(p)ppGpp synthase/HD superfamily hydrolase
MGLILSLQNNTVTGGRMMDIVEKAIIFAAKAHKEQNRKCTDIPYITHPFAVGMLLQKANCSDEVIAAGILHDTLEDTKTTYEELVEQFGFRVANLVRAASENDKSLPWEVRKQHTIEHLKEQDIGEIQVISADKLHNLKSIQADFEAHGEEVWKRFNRGKQDQHWYYASIVREMAPRKQEFILIGELEKVVKEIFEQ